MNIRLRSFVLAPLFVLFSVPLFAFAANDGQVLYNGTSGLASSTTFVFDEVSNTLTLPSMIVSSTTAQSLSTTRGTFTQSLANTGTTSLATTTVSTITLKNRLTQDIASSTTSVSIPYTGRTGGVPSEMAVYKRLLFIANAASGTVSVLELPRLRPVATITTGGRPTGMSFSGDLMLIVDNSSDSLMVYDMSRPTSPELLTTVPTGSAPVAVETQGRYAYVTNAGSDSVSVIDLVNPRTARVVGTAVLPFSNAPKAIAVSGSYAYVAASSTGLIHIVNISDPTNPAVVSAIAVGPDAADIYVKGTVVYAISYYSGNLQSIDVSDPSNPRLASTVTFPTSWTMRSITGSGKYLYVALTRMGSVGVLDISNPLVPQRQGLFSAQMDVASLLPVDGYIYAFSQSLSLVRAVDLGGIEAASLSASAASVGSLAVSGDASVSGVVGAGSIKVGSGGIFSQGSIAASIGAFVSAIISSLTAYTGNFGTLVATSSAQLASTTLNGATLAADFTATSSFASLGTATFAGAAVFDGPATFNGSVSLPSFSASTISASSSSATNGTFSNLFASAASFDGAAVFNGSATFNGGVSLPSFSATTLTASSASATNGSFSALSAGDIAANAGQFVSGIFQSFNTSAGTTGVLQATSSAVLASTTLSGMTIANDIIASGTVTLNGTTSLNTGAANAFTVQSFIASAASFVSSITQSFTASSASIGNLQTGTLTATSSATLASATVYGTLTTGSISATTTATSSFAGGINITSGCLAINGTCLSLATSSSSSGGSSGTSTPYAAAIRRATAQTISANATTKIDFTSTDFSNNTTVDLVNDRITAPATGIYVVSGSGSFTTSSNVSCVHLYKNGSEIGDSCDGTTAAQTRAMTITRILSLTAGDYVEIFLQNSDASSHPTGTATGDQPTLSIVYVSSPVTAGSITNGGNAFGATTTIGTTDSNTLSLITNNTSRINITSGGKVMVGTSTTNATNNTGDFTIGLSSCNVNGGFELQNAGGVRRMFCIDPSGNLAMVNQNSNSYIGSWNSSTGAYTAVSDRRLKQDIRDASSTLATALALKPREFAFRTDASTTVMGFVAQEVYEAFPEAVSHPDDGTVTIDRMNSPWTLDYNQLTTLAILAIQRVATISEEFAVNLRGWLGSASNGITDIFAEKLHAKQVCLDNNGTEVCVNGAQLQNMMTGSAAGSGSGSSGGSGTVSTSTPSDVTPPVFNLNGAATSSVVSVGSVYSDPVTATDETAPANPTVTVVVNDSAPVSVSELQLDTSAEAAYTLDYSATDAAGNVAHMTRTVVVQQQ